MADDQNTPDDGTGGGDPAPKTFDEDYVKKLRSESAGYRTSAATTKSERDAEKARADTALAELETLRSESAGALGLTAAAEARALKLEVALEKGLPLTLAKRLDGATREELIADADALLAFAGAAPEGASRTYLPQGNQPAPASKPDVNGALRVLARGGA